MEPTLQKFIWRHCRIEQLFLLVITILFFPILYVSLEIPKRIIDGIVSHDNGPQLFLSQRFDQLDYVLILTLSLLLILILRAGIFFFLSLFRSRLGERLLRRLRYLLFKKAMMLPLSQISHKNVISMISSELESYSIPFSSGISFQFLKIGTIITIAVFILAQNLILGIFAIGIYTLQLYVIPKIQLQIRALTHSSVAANEKFSARIAESIKGFQEVQTNDTILWELANTSKNLDRMFMLRSKISQNKILVEFVKSFVNQFIPLFFYAFGCVLLFSNEITLGALIAVILASKELPTEWQGLIDGKDKSTEEKQKYNAILDQFQIKVNASELASNTKTNVVSNLTGNFELQNVSLNNSDGYQALENINLKIPLNGTTAILGGHNSGGQDLAQLIPPLCVPESGVVTLSGLDIDTIAPASLGRLISYVDENPFIFDGSIRDNLMYGTRHRPISVENDTENQKNDEKRFIKEARKSGNSSDNISANWIDYSRMRLNPDEFNDIFLNEVIETSGLKQELVEFGLSAKLNFETNKEVTNLILQARKECGQLFEDPKLAELLETFDQKRFNNSISVGENILMGTPLGGISNFEAVTAHPYTISVLDKAGILNLMIETGLSVATIMVELFQDLPEGHEFFDKYSFIKFDKLSQFQNIINQSAVSGIHQLRPRDSAKLIGLAFSLIPDQHRLGLNTKEIKSKIFEARQLFIKSPPDDLIALVEFFNTETYNKSSSIQDNIIFGKIAHGKSQAPRQINRVLDEVIANFGLIAPIIKIALNERVGQNGLHLSGAQKQKLGLARALLKKPDLLILNNAINNLDPFAQESIIKHVISYNGSKGLICVITRPELAKYFDRIVLLESGQIIETGRVEDLMKTDSKIKKLLDNQQL